MALVVFDSGDNAFCGKENQAREILGDGLSIAVGVALGDDAAHGLSPDDLIYGDARRVPGCGASGGTDGRRRPAPPRPRRGRPLADGAGVRPARHGAPAAGGTR